MPTQNAVGIGGNLFQLVVFKTAHFPPKKFKSTDGDGKDTGAVELKDLFDTRVPILSNRDYLASFLQKKQELRSILLGA